MNLSNFEKFIDKTILDRGYHYYIEGNIIEAFKKSESEYLFTIEGTDNYEVVVEINQDGEIRYSDCDCPYDYGPVCKHEASAYFQLYEILNQKEPASNKTQRKTKIEDVLLTLSKDELVNIILDITNTDAVLENSLLMKYSNGSSEQELESCQKLIDEIVRKYTGREGFIKYKDTAGFTSDLEAILQKASGTANLKLAADIAALLLEEAVYAFQYADDSGGEIGHLVRLILDTLEDISLEAKGNIHGTSIFAKLMTLAGSEVFDGWEDFRIDLLNVSLIFADDDILREEIWKTVESLIREEYGDEFTKYKNESLLQLLYQLIDEYGTEEEAIEFLQSHLHLPSFREELINKHVLEKNYQKVLEVALEGEGQDYQYAGLVSRWKKYRYQAYKSLGMREEQESLARELFFKGDFDYYQELKELAAGGQTESYEDLKQELKHRQGWHTDRLFLQLIEAEDDKEELLEFIRGNPEYVEEYADKLAERFKEEVVEIYREYLFSEAKAASNRSHYREIGRKIKRFSVIAGKPKQIQVIDELKELYKKKPAFLDELGKVR